LRPPDPKYDQHRSIPTGWPLQRVVVVPTAALAVGWCRTIQRIVRPTKSAPVGSPRLFAARRNATTIPPVCLFISLAISVLITRTDLTTSRRLHYNY
jgi:hypothetical protein